LLRWDLLVGPSLKLLKATYLKLLLSANRVVVKLMAPLYILLLRYYRHQVKTKDFYLLGRIQELDYCLREALASVADYFRVVRILTEIFSESQATTQ
jgi:hypothetical protein